eukprot:TRINITY_DN14795_c0_g1_i1.p1 TRINITY_DN14795_c0_g1~~TRINITY_DN14795_c0_g1_i1.p1  ORF type:complete len:239 (-),score=28.08 TRINITY_DN14795_c0_g1_i1:150-866(-)
MAAMEVTLNPIHDASQATLHRFAVSPRCSSSLRYKDCALHYQRAFLSSTSYLSYICRSSKISATTTSLQAKQLSTDSQEYENNHVNDLQRSLKNVMPESMGKFPWKKAFMKVTAVSIVGAAKFLLVTTLIVTFLNETSFCLMEDKDVFVPIGLFIGCVFAESIKNTALELFENLKDKNSPWYFLTVALASMLIKFLAPFYPYWGRLILPHIANGALWQTIWIIRNWHKAINQNHLINN